MDGFVRVPVREQDAKERAKNFKEVCLGYNKEEAESEAKRCLGCPNPKCVEGCPVSIDIPGFIKEVKEGNVEAAKGVNITFWYEGSEIQPADSKYVHVSITLNEAIEGEDFSVVHEHDGEAEEVSDDNIESVSADGATFDANQFSVYVVAGTTGKNRIKVTFMNGTEEIATMYVKANDDMEQVLYDPSFTLGEKEVFVGWTEDPEYTSATKGFSIEEVRDKISAKLPPESDGEEVTYYAMIFKGYSVTYTDKTGASLGQHIVKIKADATEEELNVEYTVSMAYTPEDDEHDFQGWYAVEGVNNIKKNAVLVEKENSTADEDIYYYFTGLLLILLLYELYYYRRSEQ